MRKLIYLALFCVCSFLANAQLTGFNLGQIHHAFQLKYADNGRCPQSFVDSLKARTPKSMHETCRMSGTMSNTWALDLPGYNHVQHDNQIKGNRNFKQPSQSYIFAFVDFYKKWNFKNLIWTMNTISPYINGDARELWEKRMWASLHYIISQDINITHICLENEWYLYGDVCGISAGSPTIVDRNRYGGSTFRTNQSMSAQIQNEMRRYLNYLEPIADSVRKLLPNAVIILGTDKLGTMRGNLMYQVVQEYDFYDAIDLHIYIKPKNRAETESIVANIIRPFNFKVPFYVMECNYQYETGKTYPAYIDGTFKDDLLRAILKNGAEGVMFHTLWYRWFESDKGGYGWVKIR